MSGLRDVYMYDYDVYDVYDSRRQREGLKTCSDDDASNVLYREYDMHRGFYYVVS